MPKIPVFQTQARPTAEVGSIRSDIKIDPTKTMAGALSTVATAAQEYYLKEKDISNKAEAGKLYSEATKEIYQAKSEAELKTSPDEGVVYFNTRLEDISKKYGQRANNKNIQRYFVGTLNKEKGNYVNSILKTTRDNLVTTRVDQVTSTIKRKIFDTIHSGDNYSFSILSKDVLYDYDQLEKDGIVGKLDVKKFRESLPQMIEKEMVNKVAINNAYQALISLDNPNNYKSIIGEEREKLKGELRTKAEFQNKSVTFVNGVQLLESKKKIAEALKGNNNEQLGVDPSQLSKFYTGNKEYDDQIFNLNQKFINKNISIDTDYISNDKIINKILNEEITHPFQKFTLPGEIVAKSITERIGDGSVNLDDDNFFNKIFESSKDKKKSKETKEFFSFINKVVSAVEGSPSAKIFDQNYNNRLSSFRQDMYNNFNNGINNNIPITELLNPKSENYIAKNIINYLPTKSNLKDALMSYAMKRENEVTEKPPLRTEGESYASWQERYRKWKSTQKK